MRGTRWTKGWLAAAVTLSALACFKSPAKKAAEVRECSRITMDAQGAAQCLVLQYRWKQSAALAAATAYQEQQDALAQSRADSSWRADAAKHKREIADCATDPSGDTCTRQRKMQAGSCLQLYYKWSPTRALAVDDSIRLAQTKR